VTGIHAAQGRGKRLGRPRRVFRRDHALRLRTEGKSWRQIAAALGVPFSTVIDSCRGE
jgi:putative DNA-invertase from lambdoid prophage Rac